MHLSPGVPDAPPLRIALVVHGRFHAFDLARALIRRGNDVTVLTNYPAWAAPRFGLRPEHLRTFPMHGLLGRLSLRLRLHRRLERQLHELFGRWAAGQLARGTWDVIHPFTGIAEETLRQPSQAVRVIMRGSAHIRTQARLLAEEEARTGAPQDRPSPWMIAREEREYALAERVLVLSTFAWDSFVAEGFPAERLLMVPLGAEVEAFRPAPEAAQERYSRLRAGEPLRVLYVGAKSFQKGMWDLVSVVNSVDPTRFRFRLVGPDLPETAALLDSVRERIDNVEKQPHYRLVDQYAWADLFLFPTIQDGFAAVLAQANAAGLPILTTTNCAGPDLVRQGESGWVLPIRAPDAFRDRLEWCANHREELAQMAKHVYDDHRPRTWDDVARDFEMQVRGLTPLPQEAAHE